MLAIILKIILLIFIIVLICKSFTIIQPNHVGLKITLGKYKGKLQPGLHFILPFIQQVKVVTFAQIPHSLGKQVAITKDNAEVTCELSMNYHITNAESYCFNNEDSVLSVEQQTRAQLRGIIGEKELNDILNQTTEINAKLQKQLDAITDPYGIKVDRINIGEIHPSDAVNESMEKQLAATREKVAIIEKSEGTATATKQKADAEYYRVTKAADAEAYRISEINKALANVPDSYFKDQEIKALKEFATDSSNTLIIPNKLMNEMGDLPTATKIVQASAHQSKKNSQKAKK